jgi:hypothetical protein
MLYWAFLRLLVQLVDIPDITPSRKIMVKWTRWIEVVLHLCFIITSGLLWGWWDKNNFCISKLPSVIIAIAIKLQYHLPTLMGDWLSVITSFKTSYISFIVLWCTSAEQFSHICHFCVSSTGPRSYCLVAVNLKPPLLLESDNHIIVSVITTLPCPIWTPDVLHYCYRTMDHKNKWGPEPLESGLSTHHFLQDTWKLMSTSILIPQQF